MLADRADVLEGRVGARVGGFLRRAGAGPLAAAVERNPLPALAGMEDLLSALRRSGHVAGPAEVREAYIERSGEISVVRRGEASSEARAPSHEPAASTPDPPSMRNPG